MHKVKLSRGHIPYRKNSPIVQQDVIDREFVTSEEKRAYLLGLEDGNGYQFLKATDLSIPWRTLFVYARQIEDETSSVEDSNVSGIYSVAVPSYFSDGKAVSAALDAFHNTIAIKVLDDFEFTVKGPKHDILVESEDHEPYSLNNYVGEVYFEKPLQSQAAENRAFHLKLTRNKVGRFVSNAEKTKNLPITTPEQLEEKYPGDTQAQIDQLETRLTELGGPAFRPGIFALADNTEYEGFTYGNIWNGWACPYFSLPVALKIVAGMNGIYDAGKDCIIVPCDDDEDPYIFESKIVDGVTYYPVGAGCWTWDEKVQEEGKVHSLSFEGNLQITADGEEYKGTFSGSIQDDIVSIGGSSHPGVVIPAIQDLPKRFVSHAAEIAELIAYCVNEGQHHRGSFNLEEVGSNSSGEILIVFFIEGLAALLNHFYEEQKPLPQVEARHRVNCICCGELVDKRDCLHGLEGEGYLCPACIECAVEINTEDGYIFKKKQDGTWSDGDMSFDDLGQMEVFFTIPRKKT